MAQSGIADVAGARVAWWADGDGEADATPLVLVHAGVADARMWEPLLPALTPSYRVVRYDMRGFGRTRSAAGTFSSARDFAGLLDALGIAQAHVVGASSGGQVALELAATEPARVASLVLLAAALVAEMQRGSFDLQLREGAEEVELDPPVSERLDTIDVPVTVAVGDRDVADFAPVAELLSTELPNASLERIRGAGHLLALDEPAAVAQLVARHVDALTRRASPPR